MNETILSSVILPIALVIIMLSMGLTLVKDDFLRIAKYPKAALIGFTNQLLLLPIIGFGLANVFPLSPELAVGVMILAACPGGVTSNLVTHLSKGDVALSISLTSITSLITVFTVPLITAFSLDYFMNDGNSQTIELPLLRTILQIMVITIIPVSIGMVINHYRPEFSKRMEKPLRIFSMVVFASAIIGITIANQDKIFPSLQSLAAVTLTLNIITMALGIIAARWFRLNLKETISITFESGIQNGTLAIVIATTILERMDMALPAAVYSLLMFFTGGLLMWFFDRQRKSGNWE